MTCEYSPIVPFSPNFSHMYRILSLIILSSFLFTSMLHAAVIYPTNTPALETPGGTFQTYFDNMYTGTQCNAWGQVVWGFSLVWVPSCVTPVASGLFFAGQTSGDTIRFDWTDWIRNNVLYNNGTNIGINTTSPSTRLDVNGTVRIRGGVPGNGKFLVSDATGLASWTDIVPATTLSITGSVVGSTLYYDGTDWIPNINLFNTGANIGIGTSTPTAKLEVAGQIKVTGGGVGSGRFLVSDATGLASWTDNIAATSFSISGSTLGSTLYYDGANWMATTNLYNTGGNIGIGTLTPQYKLDVLGNNSIIRAGSGFCLGMTASGCVYDWTDLNNVVKSSWTPNYIAKFNSGWLIDNSQLYETGWRLFIWDVSSIIAGNATLANITIKSFGATNSSNPFLTLSENGSQECRMWINGVNKLGSNCSWTAGLWGSYQPNQIIKADSAGTDLTGSLMYENAWNVWIGIINPGAKLDINGQIKITGGTPGVGKILTSDATGLATWSNWFSGSVTASGIVWPAGSENYISKFGPGGNGLVTSQIFDNGFGVGIGTSSIASKFEIWDGATSILHMRNANLGVGANATNYLATGINNFGIGNSSLANLTTGNNNIAFWGLALNSNTTGNSNIAIWETSLSSNITGAGNIAIGQSVLNVNTSWNTNIWIWLLSLASNTTWSDNIALSNFSLYSNTTWTRNVAIWSRSLNSNTIGSYNTANGSHTLESNLTGDFNTVMGFNAMYLNQDGGYNTAIGNDTLYNNISGFDNVWIWNSALHQSIWSNNTALWTSAWYHLLAGSRNTVIGFDAQLVSSTWSNQLSIWNIIYGNSLGYNGDGNIGIGTGINLTTKLTVAGQIKITGGAPGVGKILTSDANGIATWSNWFSGSVTASGITGGTQNYIPKFGPGGVGLLSSLLYETGGFMAVWSTTPTSRFEVWNGTASLFHMRGTNNIGIGSTTTRYQTSGSANVWVGNNTLRTLTTGYNNSAFGDSTLYGNTAGYFNSALGSQALYSNSVGNWNVWLGTQALWTSLNGSYNIAIGWQALYSNLANNDNVAIGYQALRASVANNNIGIGSNAGSTITTGANNIIIGTNVAAISNTASNQLNIGNWIYGADGRISIGRTNVSSWAYRVDVANGFVNSASGYCINNTCIPNWSGIFDAINGQGNYLPKWNTSGTGLIASRISDDGTDIAISSGALQQILITPSNQEQYQQVLLSSGWVLKKGLTTREKLRIFASADYGNSGDSVTIQELCFDTSSSSSCRSSSSHLPITNVPDFNTIDPKSYMGGIWEFVMATNSTPGYFISYYTGTYMVVNSYTFSTTSFSTTDDGCNVFPYYSLYDSAADLPSVRRRDTSPPNILTVSSDTAISNVYSSTNLSLPRYKTTRVGSQFTSNVFMTPGQVLLMTIGVQSCASRADRAMALVINNQKKMTLSISEL